MEEQRYDSGGFVTIPKRKKRKGRVPKTTEFSFSERANAAIVEIERTDWIKQCRDIVQQCFESLDWIPSEIRVFCLGLGSPVASKNSAAQLAFITLICDAFHIDRNKVSFFDPHFSEDDVRGLLEMRYVLPSENKHGRYTFSQKTLLFMPHCNVKLYENVLRYNWNMEALPSILIMGNNFEDYILSTPEWKLQTTLPCLSRIGKYLICKPLPDSETHYSAFNNTVLQYVECQLLPSINEPIWQLPDEVEEDGVEVT